MRLFKARIKEKGGHCVYPEYMADDDFWRWHDPRAFLVNFWGLNEPDVEFYALFEVIDGKEVRI